MLQVTGGSSRLVRRQREQRGNAARVFIVVSVGRLDEAG